MINIWVMFFLGNTILRVSSADYDGFTIQRATILRGAIMDERVGILMKEYDVMRNEIRLYINKYCIAITVIGSTDLVK